jgi:hypothetical protein
MGRFGGNMRRLSVNGLVSTLPPGISFMKPNSCSLRFQFAQNIQHRIDPLDITTHAKGGLQTKPLKLGTDLTITCA